MKLENLTITGLQVENVMRINVINLKPGIGLVEIAGKNRQGKSSTLAAIDMALGGKSKIPWEPVKQGEERAMIKLALGNEDGLQLVITRKFIAQDEADTGKTYTTQFKVEDATGKQHGQALLDSFLSQISFDPQAFVDAKPEEQTKILKGLVADFDFDDAARRRKEAYDARTDLNREIKRLDALSNADVPVGTPSVLVDTEALVGK